MQWKGNRWHQILVAVSYFITPFDNALYNIMENHSITS